MHAGSRQSAPQAGGQVEAASDSSCGSSTFPVCLRPQVKYKEVMKQYNLGPNGGILTSLNLFATRFDQVRFCVPIATKGLLVRDLKRFSSHAEPASLAVVRRAGAWRM